MQLLLLLLLLLLFDTQIRWRSGQPTMLVSVLYITVGRLSEATYLILEIMCCISKF